MTKLIITSDDGDITQQAIIMIITWSNNDLVNRHFYLSLLRWVDSLNLGDTYMHL